MTVESLPFVPPAPTNHPKNLPVWQLLWNITRSSISIWPDYAFRWCSIRNSVMGLKTIVVSDPEGVRHVLTANAANYRRPPAVTRFARPLGGSGLFLAEGVDCSIGALFSRQLSRPAAFASLLPPFARRGLSSVAFARKVAASQSLESLSGYGFGGGLARLVLHAGERRSRDTEPYRARVIRQAAEPVRRVCEKRRTPSPS